ncbi:histidine kinase [Microcella daejeonensis]|uniref:histidine kinase n=1 Tax=Microcella daejeonensis TaxID=2994971 RepID=A0A9E8SBC5_9MICO|nr:histidine kinase [Microcella daejeonensis]WAB81442.1 histidine kinase [Microcella daejeonensis]
MISQSASGTGPSTGGSSSETTAVSVTRSITATWWYTVAGILFIEGVVVPLWLEAMVGLGLPRATYLPVFIAGLLWWASTFVLLLDYRDRRSDHGVVRRARWLVPLLVAVAVGVLAGILSGLWLIAVMPLVQSAMLLTWPPGVRWRVTAAATLLLVGVSALDARLAFDVQNGFEGLPTLLIGYSVVIPAATVLSLWWWDVLVTLDRARLSEARLAATQERLRVATDVHDLQGHHLQVIALQLELAERLMERDPSAALEQLRAARGSVDDARQGTRDLALRFRSTSLRDELANAVDLLRAAGTDATVEVDGDCDAAPADVLGPVVRETTTNVLRHGGGEWARLSLTREGGSWRYRIANDAGGHPVDHHDGGGAGLEGLQRRAEDAGGTLEVTRDTGEFSVTMTVPGVAS